MATVKNETLVCEVNVDSITFKHMERNSAGEFQVVGSASFACSSVPDMLENGDSFASMKAYGIRAFLNDRSSDFRKHGISAYMGAMQDVYDNLLVKGLYKAKRTGKAPSVDTLLIQAIAQLKGISAAQAEVSVKALTKEQRAKLAANPAVANLMKELAQVKREAEATNLDDLLSIETTEGEQA